MVVLGGALVAVLALAGCGGGSSSATTSTSTPSTNTGGSATGRLSAFRSCMAGQGITLSQRNRRSNGGTPSTTPGETRPAGGFGGASRFNTPPPGVNATKYQAALNACRSQLPPGGNFNSTAFQAYRSCLSDHNVTMPASGGFAGINRNDPKVKAAMAACRALLPAGGSSSTTTPGS